jgi:hypothetical protein
MLQQEHTVLNRCSTGVGYKNKAKPNQALHKQWQQTSQWMALHKHQINHSLID